MSSLYVTDSQVLERLVFGRGPHVAAHDLPPKMVVHVALNFRVQE